VSGRRRATAPEVKHALRLRERGWKLLDIAGAFGVSEATVSRWCRGITRHEVTGGLTSLRASRASATRRAQESDPGAWQS
jgi:predicted transcriptional regulator